MKIDLNMIKRSILFFWFIWFFVVFLTNFFEGAKVLNYLPNSWRFCSGNFINISQVTEIYNTPFWVTCVMYGTILLGESVVSLSFL
jgi:hypothetical protein